MLKGVALTLARGDFCVLVGSNGSGKSTLLRTISGEESLDAGRIYIADRDVTHVNRTALIASVVQDVNQGTISDMTLLENMVLSASRGQKNRFRWTRLHRKTAIGQLEVLGLAHAIDMPLKHLSGGQRQMVATLMAIQSKPALLLLDEHTAALDPKMQRTLMNYTCNAVAQFNMTALMITHQLEDAIHHGNRLIMLNQGRIVLDVSGEKKAALTMSQLLSLYDQHDKEVCDVA